ncbi:MAG: hypothetical protein J6W45_02475, partial [Bacteroidales bacterium]|nr:hypothetical protein [Bacteroidales bacterium]
MDKYFFELLAKNFYLCETKVAEEKQVFTLALKYLTILSLRDESQEKQKTGLCEATLRQSLQP